VFTFILVTTLASMASVMFHFGAAELLLSRVQRELRFARLRVTILIVGFIIVHLIEASVFAVALKYLLDAGSYGSLQGVDTANAGSLLYYSAITFTTVGYGDITPLGDIRIFAAVEALVGMVLVAWTASIIFTIMQRIWHSKASQEQQTEAV